MIKFVNFFYSHDNSRKTLYTENGHFQDDGETHNFASAEEALEKSTDNSVVFWDNNYHGVGKVPEPVTN